MSLAEWIEVLAIGIIATMSWFAWPYLSSPTPVWEIVLDVSVLLLMQSLLRDLSILLRRRHLTAIEFPNEAQCFCLETSVGITGVVIGAILVGLGSSTEVTIGHWVIVLITAGTMIFGFLIKDWVISWNPLGLHREKDHLNLIIRWKTKSK